MMSDKEPMLFRPLLGSLRPVTPAAEDAVKSLPRDRNVRIEIKQIRGNTRRLGLYWVCLKVACEQLSDAVDGIMTPRVLHRYLKRKLGLSAPVVSKKTGEILEWDDESIGFDSMPESERMAYIDQALELLSRWIGTDITTLRNEGEAQFGEAA
jgi:hypothetical protein